METLNSPKGNLHLQALRFLLTAALALLSVGFPLSALILMIATACQFLPNTEILVLVIGLILIGLTTIAITVVVHCLDKGSQRQALRVMAAIAVVGVVTTTLMQIHGLGWAVPRFLPLVTLLRLDAIDITAAEDATAFEPWFEIWVILIAFTFAAKWLVSRVIQHKSALIPRR